MGTRQGGQGRAFFTKAGSTGCSHGPDNWTCWERTRTRSWQGSGQAWQQAGSGSRQRCLQGGQGPGWQRWGSLVGWWQEGGALQGSLQRGGLVLLSRPHGTTRTVDPQVHRTSTVSGQG